MRLTKLSCCIIFILSLLSCHKDAPTEEPVFSFQNLRSIIKSVRSSQIIVPRFDSRGENIIFNGKLSGDIWNAIYTVPVQGGIPTKVYETYEDLGFPSFSENNTHIVFTKGLSQQINILNLETLESSELPIYGNHPSLLFDGNTILFSGVIDANLYLYDMPTGRIKPVTETYISSNLYPYILPDKISVLWVEKRKSKKIILKSTRLDSMKITSLKELPHPLLSLTSSPSGKWIIASRYSGIPVGFKTTDAILTEVKISPSSEKSETEFFALYPDWSPIGNSVVYVGASGTDLESSNPFFKNQTFHGDITVAEVRWEKINDSEIYQRPQVETAAFFQELPQPPKIVPPSIERTNNPPKIISIPSQDVLVGDVFLYRIKAVEIDLYDQLSYSIVSGPENAEILKKTGILIWIPLDTGQFNFTVSAHDDKEGIDFQSFTVNVISKPHWEYLSLLAKQPEHHISNFTGSLTFEDSNNDGFLSSGESAHILLKLKNLTAKTLDSLTIKLISTTQSEEIEWENMAAFSEFESNKEESIRIPIKGLANLRNRPIIINGLVYGNFGIQFLPATLVINGRNLKK